MRQRRMIWGAIVLSTFLYAVVAYVTAGHPERSFDETAREPVALALMGAVFATFIAALVVPSTIRAKDRTQAFIVSLAMFDACAVIGLATAIVQGDWHFYLAPWVLALIGFAREWPRESS